MYFVWLNACRFLKLPAWVSVMLTGRPQVEDSFKLWKPEWIKPNDAENERDLLELLRHRLVQGNYFLPDSEPLTLAADLMLRKSQVSKVKYVLGVEFGVGYCMLGGRCVFVWVGDALGSSWCTRRATLSLRH
jgi:hypothetical protein